MLHRHHFVLFDQHPLSGECIVAVCSNCGLAFNDTTHNARTYERYYAELSKYISPLPPSEHARTFSAVADAFEAKFPDKNVSILDVGCGNGGLLAALQERGYLNIAGMDPTPAGAAAVQTQLRIECRVGVLANPPFQSGGFDVVISTGVFEHLLEPSRDLGCLKELLRPEGVAFVVVPDASRYHLFPDAPFQQFNIEHINHFSQQTLNSLFQINGWEAIHTGELVVEGSPTWKEPAVYGCFTPGHAPGKKALEKDTRLTASLQTYIADSKAMITRINTQLDEELKDEKEIVIWGAGQTASVLLEMTVLRNKKIRAVIDSNPLFHGKKFCSAAIDEPAVISGYSGPIVVATVRAREAVATYIQEKLGANNTLVTFSLA